MQGWIVAGWVGLGLWTAIGLAGSGLWFFVELAGRRGGRAAHAIGESLWFGFAGVPFLILFAVLVNLCQALGFAAGSKALSKMK